MNSDRPQAYFRVPQQAQPNAPLFVFLPGMDGTGRLLRVQTEGLERLFDVRCLAIPPDDLTSWEQLTDQVVQLVERELAQKPSQPTFLCGESFGGCLALKVILKAPHLFQKLILVNPASSFNRRPWMQWGAQLTQFLPDPLYRLSCIGLLPLLASLGQIEAEPRSDLLTAMQSVAPQSALWRLSLVSQFNLAEADLHRISQPTLLIASKGDRLLPSVIEAEHLLNHLPHAEMIVLPDSGHACLLESEVKLADMVQSSALLNPPLPVAQAG